MRANVSRLGRSRAVAGPVVPLTGANVGLEQVLLGGPGESRGASDGLSAGEAVAATTGRADDFRWPGGDITTEHAAVTALTSTAATELPPQPLATSKKLQKRRAARTGVPEVSTTPMRGASMRVRDAPGAGSNPARCSFATITVSAIPSPSQPMGLSGRARLMPASPPSPALSPARPGVAPGSSPFDLTALLTAAIIGKVCVAMALTVRER
jgi:hypothetical protein